VKLVIATTNKGKVAEILALLKDSGIELLSLADFPDIPDIDEDGATFMENALKKARMTSSFTGLAALADDSGLEVDALEGIPGVASARFAPTTEERNDKLLDLMKDVPDERRSARFVCALVLVTDDGHVWKTERHCEGKITRHPAGEGGFGYDPVFFHEPLGKTFAALSRAEKNRISHRGLALEEFRKAVLEDGFLGRL